MKKPLLPKSVKKPLPPTKAEDEVGAAVAVDATAADKHEDVLEEADAEDAVGAGGEGAGCWPNHW